MMVQEDEKEKRTCKNIKSSVVLDDNLNVYFSSDSTKLWIHYE
jgi:hypothetical protein